MHSPAAICRPRELAHVFRCVCLLASLMLTACATTGGPEPAELPPADPLADVQGQQLFERGAALAKQGDPIRAEQYLAAALQRGYQVAEVLPLLMRVCLASRRLGAALHYGAPQLQRDPDNIQLRYLLATVHLGLGQSEVAHQELSRVLRSDPEHALAHYLRGVIARDHFLDVATAAEDFEAYQRLQATGAHAPEVAAWLREHRFQATRTTRAPAAAEGEDTTEGEDAAEGQAEAMR